MGLTVDFVHNKQDEDSAVELLYRLQQILSGFDVLGEATTGKGLKRSLREIVAWSPVLVARLDDKIVGVAVLHINTQLSMDGFIKHNGPSGSIEMLIVDKDFRGRGIGKALVKSAEEYFVHSGCVRIEIEYLENNRTAAEVYRKLGYLNDTRLVSKVISENF